MNYIFILTVICIGASGLIAQVLLLRELLVSFYGNELTLGVILANWLLCETIGVFCVGKFIDKVKNKLNALIILQVAFSLSLPLGVYLARTFKDLLGLPAGEGVGIPFIFFASLAVLSIPALCHGALFAVACKMYPGPENESSQKITSVYSQETIGTIIGGLIFTYLLIPYLNSFQTAMVIAVLNLALCLPFLKKTSAGFSKYTLLLLICSAAACAFIINSLPNIDLSSRKKEFKTGEFLESRDSIYGNVTVTRYLKEYTFFYNGSPAVTVPYPDAQFTEEFASLPLLFHPSPKKILVIGSGAGGVIDQILRHPVERVDYIELDPVIIDMLRKYPTELTRGEFSDKRTQVINTDARFFLMHKSGSYDVILVGLSEPHDLSSNRFFTREFFLLAGKKLNPDGVLALRVGGSFTYLNRELRDINFSILNALRKSYAYVKVIPGGYNLFLASGSQEITELKPADIWQNIKERGIKVNFLIPGYLQDRLSPQRLNWFLEEGARATRKSNSDIRPFALFKGLAYWNDKFFPQATKYIPLIESLTLKKITFMILVPWLFFLILCAGKKKANPAVVYAMATTGFFSMFMNLILIFSFQIFYGYLYQKIGLLISVFMLGIVIGSTTAQSCAKKIKNAMPLFLGIEAVIIVFSFAAALIIKQLPDFNALVPFVFALLFIFCGALTGSEFALASRIYPLKREATGEIAGILYAADLLGSWIAGLSAGIILLPVLGIFKSCMAIVILKLSSACLLILTSRKYFTKAKI